MENVEVKNTEVAGKHDWFQARHAVAFAASFLNTVFFLMRLNTSVTIVAIALDTESDAPHYDWNSAQRSTILSSFFWGYTAVQIPAMFAVRRLGPRKIVLIMSVLSTISTVLFVPMAALGWQGACAARVLLGISQSALMASVHQLIAYWAPPPERARMVVYAFCGQQIGTILAFAISGVISEQIGWPWVYYVTGILGVIMTGAWYWMVEDTPSQHRWASLKERNYIESSLKLVQEEKEHLKKLKVPWKGILTSIPFWTLLLGQCANAWGFWTLLTGIPSYMDGVLDFDLSANGFLSSLPYLAMWIGSLVLAWASDVLLKRKFWSVTVSRKVGTTIGLYGPALALIILSFSNNNPTSAVIILTIGVGLNAGTLVGLTPNYIDLGHNFAGNLMGIANQASCIMCIVGPLIIGFIVTDNESESQWRIVFLISAAVYIVGNTLFLIFGSGKEQPWNNPDWFKKAASDSESDATADLKINQ